MENIYFVLFFVILAFAAFFLYRSRNSLSKYVLDELRGQLQKSFFLTEKNSQKIYMKIELSLLKVFKD